MVDRGGVQRVDEADLVGDASGVGQELADPGPRLAILGELEGGTREWQRRLIPGHPGQTLTHPDRIRQLLSLALVQQRFVVERLQLGRPAGHEKVDDPLGLRGERQPACEHPGVAGGVGEGGIQQRPEGDPAEAHTEPVEELAPAEIGRRHMTRAEGGIHRFITNSSWFISVLTTRVAAARSTGGRDGSTGFSPVLSNWDASSGFWLKYARCSSNS